MNYRKTALTSFVFILLFVSLVSCSGMQAKQTDMGGMHGGHEMSMHHQHEMLNHSLGMALQGSNLVMIGQMGMAPGLDELTVDHGKMMLKNARTSMNDTMSGEAMMKMHGAGASPMDDPMMKYTHQLGEAQMQVLDFLDKHGNMKAHTMGVHHQHILLNHALKMALEGADMRMTGEMGMAAGVDKHSVSHGKTMIKNARNFWNEIMSGDSMMKMHGQGMSPESDAGMKFTHKLADAQLKVMDLLQKMPSVK